MPLSPNPGDQIDILLVNQALAALTGTGWLSGGEVSLIPDTEPPRLAVESASIRVSGETVSVDATEIEVPDSHHSYPRRDVIYADATGEVDIRRSQARPQKNADVLDPLTNDRPMQLTQPTPPNVVALEQGVPLAEVFVPPRAQSAADLEAPGGWALTDRRQSVVTDDSIVANHSELSNLTADDHPQYLPVDGSRTADPSIIGGGNVGQVLTSNGSRTQLVSPTTLFSLPKMTLDAAGGENDEYTDHIDCPEGVTILGLGVLDGNGDPQTAVRAEVEVLESSHATHTTTDPSESSSELYNSATRVSFGMVNTSGSETEASAKLHFRRHAPF